MAEGTRDATPGPPVTVHAVGVARGNPGLAGAGIVITDATGVVRERVAKYLGSATALHAQLQALALALRYARPFAPTPVALVLGNDTVVRQLTGEHPARHPAVLRMLAELIKYHDSLDARELRQRPGDLGPYPHVIKNAP